MESGKPGTPNIIGEAARARPRYLPRNPVLVVGGDGWIGVDLRTHRAPDDDTVAWIDAVAQMLERSAGPVPASGRSHGAGLFFATD